MAVERLAKGRSQAVGLRVYQRVHKASALGLGQVHQAFPKGAAELVDHRLQGMLLPSPAQGHLLGPIGPQDEDAAPRQPAPQVEEQADRAGIGPLQIIQNQEQGMLPRQRLQHVGDLLKEV